MRFLTEAECQAWAAERKYLLHDLQHRVLMDDRPSSSYVSFAIPEDAGARVALVRAMWHEARKSDPETLLWITGSSVWPSGEHMPLFTILRRGLGEERPLFDAPGCIALQGDDDGALSVLVTAVLFLWDCWLLAGNG